MRTKTHCEDGIIDYMKSIGTEFGADKSAFTTFDQTVYELCVPGITAADCNRVNIYCCCSGRSLSQAKERVMDTSRMEFWLFTIGRVLLNLPKRK